MIRTQILLTPTLTEELNALAIKEGKSFSATVRGLLESILILRRKERNPADMLMKMAKNASNKKVPPDLSVNDDCLYSRLSS